MSDSESIEHIDPSTINININELLKNKKNEDEDELENNYNSLQNNYPNLQTNFQTNTYPVNNDTRQDESSITNIEDEPWNWKIIMLFKNIGEKSLGYRWMHEQENLYNGNVDYALLIVELIFCSILSVLTGTTVLVILIKLGGSNNVVINIVLNILIMIITFILAIVYGIHRLGEYKDVARTHKYYSSKYSQISTKIKRQLSLPVNKRKNDKDYAIKVEAMYNTCQFEAPQIRSKTQKRYLKMVNQNRIARPINLTDFDTIEVVMTEECPNCSKNKGTKSINSLKNPRKTSHNKKYDHELDKFLRYY